MLVERKGLELTLGAVTDESHFARIWTSQRFGGHQRCCRSTQSCRDGQLRKKHRIPRLDIGQHAKGHHGVKILEGVGGVTINILERILARISHRHKFDHTDLGVTGHSGRLIKLRPAFEIITDDGRELTQEIHYTDIANQIGHCRDINEMRHAMHLESARASSQCMGER
ncbi:hypothetical protein D3C76_564090 [compost metagenome]